MKRERLVNRMIRIVLKSMNIGEYDERWVIRPIPKDIQNGGRNSPVPFLLYCLRLMPHNSNFDLISSCIFPPLKHLYSPLLGMT